MKLAVIGITGLVGQEIVRVLEDFDLSFTTFLPVASERSVGKKVTVREKEYTIIGLEEAVEAAPDVAIFSAGGSVSLEWAARFAEKGTFVVDNSSAFRMDEDKKLVVPEINASQLSANDRIIANPNCSTIQMVLPLSGLHKKYGIKRLVISTYQSITGTGVQAVNQYEKEKEGGKAENPAYPYPIFDNCLPHCDSFIENDYTKEEMKLVNETRKILNDDKIRITATAVRVPVHGGHSESVNIEFENPYTIEEVIGILQETPGVVVQNDPEKLSYPMPLMARGKNEVFVGRIRRDQSIENGLNLWIVADNLRKGAATNTLQIVKYLQENILVAV